MYIVSNTCVTYILVSVYSHGMYEFVNPLQVSSSAESHITEIFGGKMRSAVHSQGAKESATVQPFFTLPLDIQVNKVSKDHVTY